MDFKRIEWIFIIGFLGLNVFLFSIYREGIKEEKNVAYSKNTDSIEKRFEEDQITFNGTLSSDKPEGYYLSGEKTSFFDVIQNERTTKDNNFFKTGTELVDDSIIVYPQLNYFIDEKSIEKSLETFLSDENNVLFGTEYQYLSDFSNLEGEFPELFLAQAYKNIPFKDDTAEILLKIEKSDDSSNIHKIYKYTQTHIQNIEELRDKMDLSSEKDALETLYFNNRIPSGTKIVFRKLAYSRIYQIREKNVYVPVWFIGVRANDSNLQIEQVNAMSNTIITNTTVPKVEN